MCGIVGWVDEHSRVDKHHLAAMRDVLVHRGPDGKGLWLDAQAKVGLAHRRLSIIDLSDHAGQPMHDASNETCIVFNGEIYNHRALRKELGGRGRVL